MKDALDVVVVGQGLAGTALAWELIGRGQRVLVVDPGEPVTSSRIAAGLVTPITGQRLALGWRVDEMLAAARTFYARVESILGTRVFHPRVVRRIFRSQAEAELWSHRRTDPARHAHIARAWVPEAGPFGGCEFFGASLDCAGYLAASREWFRARGCLKEQWVDPVEVAEWPADLVVFCQGFEGSKNPWFDWIRWRAAKGEILTVRTTGLDPRMILSAGQWVVPTIPDAENPETITNGLDQLARTGSTYDWESLDTHPTAEARWRLMEGLARLQSHPFEVVAHHAAVRPIICESRAIIGRHPGSPKLGFFNGLGSKGSLHAPFFARQLADHLIDHRPLEETADIRRNHA